MPGYIIVPIELAIKLVTEAEVVAEAKVDFSLMPYNDGKEDVNSEFAFISENFLSVPFQNRNFLLKPGVHLHWTLPDALTMGKIIDHDKRDNKFKGKHVTHNDVPDRWIIKRSQSDGISKEKTWIVESNYLHPAGEMNKYNAITFPFEKESWAVPYRYMGRSYEYTNGAIYKSPDPLSDYLPHLTAVGYGEP